MPEPQTVPAVPHSVPLFVNPSRKGGPAAAERVLAYERAIAPETAALTSQYKKEGKALDMKGNLRPSLQMRLWVHRGDPKSSMEMDRAHLVVWMNEELKGKQLQMGGFTKVVSGGTEILIPAAFATKSIVDLCKGKVITDNLSEGIKDIALDISKVAGVEIAPKFFESLVDNMVVIGVAYNVIKSAGLTVVLIMDAWERSKAKQALMSSFSVIEEEALMAGVTCYNKDIAKSATGIVTSLTKGTGSALGVGGAVGLAVAGVEFIIWLVLAVIEFVRVREANNALQSGNLTIETMRKVPTLGLILPHLSTADPLSIMGILPPGWRLALKEHSPVISILRVKAAQNQTFSQSLNEFTSADDFMKSNPWDDEQRRIVYLLWETNYHLYDQKYELYESDGKTLVYKAPPVSNYQKIKEWAKQKALPVWNKIKAAAGEAAGKAKEKIAPALTLFKARVEYMFGNLRDILAEKNKIAKLPLAIAVLLIKSEHAKVHPVEGIYQAAPLPQTTGSGSGLSSTGTTQGLPEASQLPQETESGSGLSSTGTTQGSEATQLPQETESGSGLSSTEQPSISDTQALPDIQIIETWVHRGMELKLEDVEDV